MFLGLDLGTTSVKALVADEGGRVVCRASVPLQICYTKDGGVEQDIEDIWSAAVSAISQVTRQCPQIEAIGVSSQGGALQLLDDQDKSAGKVISWLDGRGRPYDDRITAELGRDWFAEHVGHGGSAIVIGQLLRLREQNVLGDGLHSKISFVGDVIVSRLCGKRAHDPTSLSLAMLYNSSLGDADPDLLCRLGIDKQQLPELLSASTVAGELKRDVAEQTGLPAFIPVSPAVHDQYAGALAAGVTKPGDVMLGTGTAWVLLAVMDSLIPPIINDAFVCRHPVDNTYGQILSLRNGGSSFRWAVELVGLSSADDDEIDGVIGRAPPGSDGLCFWPFLAAAGEGLRPKTSGRLSGLRLSHSSSHILRAVIEGLAFEAARYLKFLVDANVSVKRLVMCGGASHSRVTPQIVADVTGLQVECICESAGSALGAAIIARSLIEPQMNLEEIITVMRSSNPPLAPRGNLEYERLFREYLASLPMARDE